MMLFILTNMILFLIKQYEQMLDSTFVRSRLYLQNLISLCRNGLIVCCSDLEKLPYKSFLLNDCTKCFRKSKYALALYGTIHYIYWALNEFAEA